MWLQWEVKKAHQNLLPSVFQGLEESEWFWRKEESLCRADLGLSPVDQEARPCHESLVMTGDTGMSTMGCRFGTWNGSPYVKDVRGHLGWPG